MLKYHRYLIYAYGFLSFAALIIGFVINSNLPEESNIFHDFSGGMKTVFIAIFLLIIGGHCVKLVYYSIRYSSQYSSIFAPPVFAIFVSMLMWYNLNMFSHNNDFLSTKITDVAAVRSYYFPKILFVIFCDLLFWHCLCYFRVKNAPEQKDNLGPNIKVRYW